MYRPKIFAHRGASGTRFENTMVAFNHAFKLGADGLEIDVQLTEDGIPIVIHDADLTRLAGIPRSIATLTYAEIRKIKVGKKFIRLISNYPIPTLIEVASFCQSHKLALNVELKETVTERPEYIPEILDSVSLVDHVHISSFDYQLLERVKEINPNMETALLLRKKTVDWNQLQSYIFADGFHIHKRLLVAPYSSNLIETGKKYAFME